MTAAIKFDETHARIAARLEPHEIGSGGDLTLNADRAAGIAAAVVREDLKRLRRWNADLQMEREALVENLERLLRQRAQLRVERDAARLLADIRYELLRQAVRGLAYPHQGETDG